MYARLCAAQASSHSLSRAVRPRRDIMVSSWQVLSCPETGSAVRARSLSSSRPRGCRRRRVARAVAGSRPGCLALRGAGLRPRPGSLASGASSRCLSWSARAEFSSLTYPEPASTVRSLGLIPAWASCSRQVPGTGAQWRAVGRVLGQHRAGGDPAGGDHGLAVAAGHVDFLVAHHPHVRAGGVRPRPGAGPVRARRLTGRAAAAPLPGRRGRVPGILPGPLGLTAGLVLGREPVPGPGQPLPPLSPPGQRPRGRRLRAGVFGGVSRGRRREPSRSAAAPGSPSARRAAPR